MAQVDYQMRTKEDNHIFCEVCGTVQTTREKCGVCGCRVYERKPYSLLKTSLYTLSAFILLFPANLLPMMIITQLKVPYVNTIWDGVVGFYDKGEYFLAFIVWFASIFIPTFKILALIWLIIMAKKGKNIFSYFSTKLYKLIDFIGKYSMLDIFVVTIMTGFLQFGNLIHIEAGSAVIPFALVIIFTMLATQNFDTKLLWDTK
jgi:paraquat-inducible protein A